MVFVQASQFSLPQPTSSLSTTPHISSLLFDPHSSSLALFHSDSSFSLYPSFAPHSLLSSSSLPPPQILIPPPSSSATFLRLQNPNTRVLFLVSSPLHGASSVLLRFWILLRTSLFSKARVICNQTGLKFDENKSGVIFNVNHGVSIKLVGSINVFTMYSASSGKIWIFSARMVDDVDDDGVTLKLMKCAVIDCCVPVFAISVSFGYLILGEEKGVRVYALRPLVKGRVKRQRGEIRDLHSGLNNGKLERQKLNLRNGVHQTIEMTEGEETVEIRSNGYLERKSDKHLKLKYINLRQDKGGRAKFVMLKNKEVENYKPSKVPLQSAKAISIQVLSPNKFLILDSAGLLHVLCLSLPVIGSEIHCHVKQLTNTMKVEQLAVLPDISARAETVWISDGCHTLHMLVVSDIITSVEESESKDAEENLVGISAVHAIFTSEKIEDVIPSATNAILLLGQGNLYAYTIS